jgi:hypothetical protein
LDRTVAGSNRAALVLKLARAFLPVRFNPIHSSCSASAKSESHGRDTCATNNNNAQFFGTIAEEQDNSFGFLNLIERADANFSHGIGAAFQNVCQLNIQDFDAEVLYSLAAFTLVSKANVLNTSARMRLADKLTLF